MLRRVRNLVLRLLNRVPAVQAQALAGLFGARPGAVQRAAAVLRNSPAETSSTSGASRAAACLVNGVRPVRAVEWWLASVFILLGGWCLVAPASVLARTIAPDIVRATCLRPVLRVGAQAPCGRFVVFSRFERSRSRPWLRAALTNSTPSLGRLTQMGGGQLPSRAAHSAVPRPYRAWLQRPSRFGR